MRNVWHHRGVISELAIWGSLVIAVPIAFIAKSGEHSQGVWVLLGMAIVAMLLSIACFSREMSNGEVSVADEGDAMLIIVGLTIFTVFVLPVVAIALVDVAENQNLRTEQTLLVLLTVAALALRVNRAVIAKTTIKNTSNHDSNESA